MTHYVKSLQIWSFLWSVFPCIRTKYGQLLRKFPYSVRIHSEYWIIGNRKKSIFGFTQWLVKKSLKVFAASSFFSRIKFFFHQHYLIRVRVFIWKKRYDIFPIWFVIGNLPPIKIVAVVLLSFPNERRPIFSLFIIRSFVPIRSSS